MNIDQKIKDNQINLEKYLKQMHIYKVFKLKRMQLL